MVVENGYFLFWQQKPEASTQIWLIKPLLQPLKRERFAKARHFKKRVLSRITFNSCLHCAFQRDKINNQIVNSFRL
jgi:hypothetical protein